MVRNPRLVTLRQCWLLTWLETQDSSLLPNAVPSHIRISIFPTVLATCIWIYGTNLIMIVETGNILLLSIYLG